MHCCGSYIYISKLTLEIQILRVLTNTPTGYGHTKKLDPKIKKKKKTFSDCNENLFKLQGSFCSLFCYNYMYLTTVNIIIKRRKRQD